MKVLVTGGAGFIGSHIVEMLIDEGYEIVIVDNLSSGYERNIHEKATFYNLDIQDNELESVIVKEKPDYVCHQAAQKDVRLSVSDPILDAKINILGTINILQNSIKHGIKKVVFASTGGAIYGEQDAFPAPETHPLKPICPYGITKLAVENYLYYYKTLYDLDYAALRYSNVYGPRQDPHGEAGVVAIFAEKMLSNEHPVINGTGEQTRDFVYVKDVAKANLLALQDRSSETVFNIGVGIETSVNELFNHLKDILNPSVEEKHAPAKEGEQQRSVIECIRAKEVLGWTPQISIREGLQQTCEYFSKKAIS